MPKVSVIVPIYNVEKYLRQCLDSLVGQTLRDIEIILVNDGSTDSSPKIIDEYAEKDKRIIVINQKNGGLGKAYNAGIDRATGEYIGFIESDDWAELDMFESLYEIGHKNKCEVVKGQFWNYDVKSGKEKLSAKMPKQDVDQVINPRKRTAVWDTPPSHWCAIYNRDWLNKTEIRFLESPGAAFQDTGFYIKVWAMAQRVWLTMKPLIHYRLGFPEQSVASKDKVFAICGEFAEVERYMADKPERFNRIKKLYNLCKFRSYIWNYHRLEGESMEQFRAVMIAEILPMFRSHKITAPNFTVYDYVKLEHKLLPKSLWIRIKFWSLKIGRLIIKPRNKNGSRVWSVLFGLIPIWKQKIRWKSVE